MGEMKITPATLAKYIDAVEDIGIDHAAKKFGVSRETMRRYVRYSKKKNEKSSKKKPDENILRQIRDRYTDEELKALISGSLGTKADTHCIHDFSGETITIGLMTDTHIGSKYTMTSMIDDAFREFDRAGVDIICHCGDVTEGLSNRPGHVYELTHIGYHAQLQEARDVFSRAPAHVFVIDGNHDRWYKQSSGAHIIEELCRDNDDMTYLGHDEGDIALSGAPVTIKLWHGEDGSSYAHSYRIQKIVESFTGGEKPHVLFCGHAHKHMYMFERHIHCIGAGSMQTQSKWMRGKRLASHTGFWIVRMRINDKGVGSFAPEWFPFYV
jgi:predicted phosphodiesterase